MPKTVFITDGSNAVAAAIAERLAADGYNLVINNPTGAMRTAYGGAVCTDECLQSVASVQRALDKAVAAFGRVDALVHTNNDIQRSSIESVSTEDFDAQFGYNAVTAFLAARVIGTHMGDNGGGRIVFISSIHDDKPTGSAPIYSISKGAVGMLVKECALQLGRRNVQSNLIEVGALEGDGDKLLSDEISGIYQMPEYRMPLKHMGQPSDISGVCAFLLSDDARFLNGASIRADGGFTFFYGDR